MVKYDANGDFDGIACDKCDKPSPPSADLIVNHGLIGLGWDCLGGAHICPDCRESVHANPDN